MQFASIPGSEQLKSNLIQSYKKGKIAHAQLFSGTAGTSVLPMALAFATYLMCENKTDEDSCGTCSNCVRMKKLMHPDVHWYFPKVSASDKGKYDKVLADAMPKWRSFVDVNPFGSQEDWAFHYGQENKFLQISREDSRQILSNVSMHPVEGGYKILFIWGIELMHPSAANAILKILEEPPKNTLYLLVSFNYEMVLQTITSRSQLINLSPISRDEVQNYLTSNHDIEEGLAKKAAKMSQGRIGSALKLITGEDKVAYDQFRQWMLACWNRDLAYLVRNSEEFAKTDKVNQKSFLTYSLSLIRNATRNLAGVESLAINPDEESFVDKFSNRLGLDKLHQLYELINQSLQHLERNSNPRITHLNLSIAILKELNG